MEFISPQQLQKYHDIIQQIKCEHRVNEELKQNILQETKTITIAHLSDGNIAERISHVDIEIFSNITDLINLYSDEIPNINELIACDGCKFYLVKIYITKSLLQKLSSKKWFINISLYNESFNMGCSIPLSNKIPILVVVPVTEQIINSTVVTNLSYSQANQFLRVELSKIEVDVSYHLKSSRKKHRLLDTRCRAAVQISKKHCPDQALSEMDKFPECKYDIVTNINSKQFIQNFIKNCYHNLDIDRLIEAENNAETTLQVTSIAGTSSFVVTPGKLHIKSNLFDLYHIKIFINKILDRPFDKRRKISITKVRNNILYSHNIDDIYRELRQLWSTI